MASHLGTYMFVFRVFQFLCSLVVIASNGWLLNYISAYRLGLGSNMIAIEIMACMLLIYTTITILLFHLCHKSASRPYLITFIVWDFILMGATFGLISIFAFAGVPNNCQGMTRSDWLPDDAPNDPAPGFQTIRFGIQGHGGMLDVYCPLPKAGYSCGVLMMFSYTFSVSLSLLRICSFRYTPNTEVSRLCEEAETKGKSERLSNEPHHSRSHSQSISTISPGNQTTSTPASPITLISPVSLTSTVGSSQRVEEIELAEATTPNGSRGESARGMDPPPYMPDLEVQRREEEARRVKGQRFPGVE